MKYSKNIRNLAESFTLTSYTIFHNRFQSKIDIWWILKITQRRVGDKFLTEQEIERASKDETNYFD